MVTRVSLGLLVLLIPGLWTCHPGSSGAYADAFTEELSRSNRHHEWSEIPVEGQSALRGFLAYPEVQGEADSVIVIHENRGLTDWVRVVADRLAESGFVAFCPDFLSGRGPGGGGTQSFADSDEARKAIYELTPDGVSAGLRASMKFLRDLPATTDQVNVVGFCWGGGQTFRFATEEPSLRAAFVFYGQPPESGFEKLTCPVYGFYGQNDSRINATIEKTKEQTNALGKRYDPVVYPSVGHAFMRTGMEAGEDEGQKKAVSEAWARMLSLLRNTEKAPLQR